MLKASNRASENMTRDNSRPESIPHIRINTASYGFRNGQFFDSTGAPLPLRPKSAEVLAVLLENRGKVVSKDELAKQVWPKTVATDVTISRCISDIRKILGDVDHSVLQTYPKRGYRITTEICPDIPSTKVPPQKSRHRTWIIAFFALPLILIVILKTYIADAEQNDGAREAVAVLPFTYTGLSEFEYLATGLPEDLIISLTEISALRVVPRNTSFDHSIARLDSKEAGKELSSKYLIYGSVFRNMENLKISIELVDAITGVSLWAKNYAGGGEVLLAYKSDVVKQLTQRVQVAVSDEEQKRLEILQPKDSTSFGELMQGRMKVSQFNYNDNLEAEKIYRATIERNPDYAPAYAELAAAFAIRLENGWAVLTEADEQRALFYANEAIRLEPTLWSGHYAMGRLAAVVGNKDLHTAEKHLREAIKLRPDSDDARVYLAVVRIFSGRQNEAIPLLEAALASHPSPPFWYYLGYGHALFHSKRYNDAVDPFNTCLEQLPTAPYCLRFQIANYAQLEQTEDALWAAEEYSLLGFDATVSAILKIAQEQDVDNRAHLEESLRKAGLPN